MNVVYYFLVIRNESLLAVYKWGGIMNDNTGITMWCAPFHNHPQEMLLNRSQCQRDVYTAQGGCQCLVYSKSTVHTSPLYRPSSVEDTRASGKAAFIPCESSAASVFSGDAHMRVLHMQLGHGGGAEPVGRAY